MNHLPIIIKREYLAKVRNKSFIIMSVLTPIVMIVLISVVAYLSQVNSDKVRVISILDESGLVIDAFASSKNITYHKLKNINLDQARALVVDASSYGLLHIEKVSDLDELSKHIKFYSNNSPSLSLIVDLENTLETKLTNLKLEKEGVDVKKIKESMTKVDIKQESFEGQKTSKADSIVKLVFGGAAGYLLFMFIIIYGNLIMRSVIEEKTSRIIEIIISSVKPIQLMLGKIIGTSLAGITQFFIWLFLGSILLLIVSITFGVDISAIQSEQHKMVNQVIKTPELHNQIQDGLSAFLNMPIANLIVAFILFFICGYLLYSSLYAAIGASVDSETDTQQFLLPVMMPLILAVYIGLFTVIEDPHGTVSTVFSFIPFTSPVVMLMRIPFGVPLWQQLLSLTLLIATFIFVVWFAAKIYRVGILMYGKKPSYRELIKWIKY